MLLPLISHDDPERERKTATSSKEALAAREREAAQNSSLQPEAWLAILHAAHGRTAETGSTLRLDSEMSRRPIDELETGSTRGGDGVLTAGAGAHAAHGQYPRFPTSLAVGWLGHERREDTDAALAK